MAYTDIDDPTIHFNTKLYTGNGGTQSITGVGFQPDWIWLKCRSNADDHTMTDAVRGNTKVLYPNSNGAEATSSIRVTSFDSDGFSLGNSGDANTNSRTFASWNWKAGGSASSNSDGSITSSVSANTTAGFSIVSYTGTGSNATIGHGLGSTLSMIIQKNRTTGTHAWNVYHKNLTSAGYNLNLDGTYAEFTSATTWNSTAPTSSVFSVGTDTNANESGSDIIAYCFAEKQGYSKFFSYEGNSNSDGTFLYLGFKPAWIMVKPIDAADNWVMFDNKRHNAINSSVSPYLLYANRNFAETTDTKLVDFVSNGVKMRSSGNTSNRSSTFIGMAFAESPFVNSNGVPNNAR